MVIGKLLGGKSYVGNPHVRFDEEEVVPVVTPSRGVLSTKKAMAISVFLMVSAIGYAVPTVSNETAKQRLPWNELVDITCTVSGTTGTIGYKFFLEAVMPDSGDVRPLLHFWDVQNGTNSTDHLVHTNGNYRLLWDARADLGQVHYSNMVLRITLREYNIQLWEGGPYWATTNIGADEPWEYGYYFWWGDTVGYKRKNKAWVTSDGSSSNVSFGIGGDVPTHNKSLTTLQNEGWITANEVLTPEHDAAQVHWGGSWRMPTKQELSDLKSKCNWSWATMNGVKGYFVSGKGDYSSNNIFLPCAGYGNGSDLFCDAGSYGYYWSSVPDLDIKSAWYLYFNSSSHYTTYYDQRRYLGQSVRPVQRVTE